MTMQQPDPGTRPFPAITGDTSPPPPALSELRVDGPRLDAHERTVPATGMADLAALLKEYTAQRPDLFHPVHRLSGVLR